MTYYPIGDPWVPQPSSGWVCPKCGSVYAPFVWTCWKCNQPTVTQPMLGGTQ